ncbi:phosphoserine phosphatase SerB [uncultured Erythrobacter sp.]|uniref:phosphoserine phosphatase SerB n=1 Tax=uncultured Erythrobacter sp. TaxID=263913 RepID=UPI0026101240|nr:phosphoserine phosphatase SerB [uncultured Erythrobacter sp.]
MLIARLIADNLDWETGIKDLRKAFPKISPRSSWSPTGWEFHSGVRLPIEQDVVELHLGMEDRKVVNNVLKIHFGLADKLFAHELIRVPQVFVSDMDSTMIGQECIDELADYAGLKDKVAAITERAMLGELDFGSALKERVALLKGLPETAIQQCLDERISFNPGARELVQTLKSRRCKTILVTGGFHHFADPVAEALGFDMVVGNRLAVEGGVLTGELDGPIVDSATKRAVLEREVAQIDQQAISLAIGDGANDIPMIEAATYGFAYHAKPKARAAADGIIDDGDLATVLSLLGISQADWS